MNNLKVMWDDGGQSARKLPLTFMTTQKIKKNGKNGPNHKKTVSITNPRADMVIQFAIQYITNPPFPYFRLNFMRKANETRE